MAKQLGYSGFSSDEELRGNDDPKSWSVPPPADGPTSLLLLLAATPGSARLRLRLLLLSLHIHLHLLLPQSHAPPPPAAAALLPRPLSNRPGGRRLGGRAGLEKFGPSYMRFIDGWADALHAADLKLNVFIGGCCGWTDPNATKTAKVHPLLG